MRKTLVSAVMAAALLAAGGAHATVLPYKSFDRLVAEAEGIVTARVQSVRTSTDTRGVIHTFVTLDQIDAVAGRTAETTLTLRLRGGRVGNDVQNIEGSPQFRSGERVLLFVQGNGRDLVPFVGWNQGVFRMVDNPASGRTELHDSEGNAVTGVERGQLLKRLRHAPSVQLQDTDGTARRAASEIAASRAGAGSTTDSGSTRLLDAVPLREAQAMAAADFIELLRRRVAQQSVLRSSAATLRSVGEATAEPATAAADRADAPPADAAARK